MKIIKRADGFTIVEVLVVTTIIAVVIVMAGALSSRLALSGSVDDLSHRITSTFNLIRLKASRNGVEYQAILNYDSTENTLTIQTKRGDSNRSSDFGSIAPESSQQLSVMSDYSVNFTNTNTIEFNPNQTVGGSGTIEIRPKTADTSVSKCGTIVINPFGRIRTVIGNWDFTTSECKAIYDKQAQPE